MMAVDSYFKINKSWEDETEYTDSNSCCRALDYDDYEAVYGCVHDEFEDLNDRQKAYSLNGRYPEKMVVLYECKHMGDKDRHHPDYNKPFEIEAICKRCHYARHYEQRQDTFKNWNMKTKRSLMDSSIHSDIRSADQSLSRNSLSIAKAAKLSTPLTQSSDKQTEAVPTFTSQSESFRCTA